MAPSRARLPQKLPDRGLGHMVREASRVFSVAMQQGLEPHGITLSQWLHLRSLWDNSGMNQSALSEYIGVKKASSTAVLNDLDSRGLIRRVRSRHDRRITHLELTSEGMALVRKLIPRAIELNLAAREGLSREEVAVFIRVINRMTDNLRRRPAPRKR